MHPFTVVMMLALHLIAGGGLLLLIGRLMPDARGVRRWAVSGIVFGASYLVRLATALQGAAPEDILGDAAMVYANLLYLDGMREFSGRRLLGWRRLGLASAAAFALELGAAQRFGPVARHVVLDGVLAGIYVASTTQVLIDLPRHPPPLRPPLRLVIVLTGVLGAFMLARGIDLTRREAGTSVYAGPLTQAFFVVAAISAALVPLSLLWLLFLRLNGRLAELATHDPLTGALNRSGLDAALARHFGDRQQARPIVALLLDIDHFKAINDAHGHAAGDAVLAAVAAALAAELRASDFVARVGGEEFVVGCAGATGPEAASFAERLRRRVEALQVTPPGTALELRCTVSIGISPGCVALAGWPQVYAQADRALYAAKAAGRNAIRATPPEEPRPAPGTVARPLLGRPSPS